MGAADRWVDPLFAPRRSAEFADFADLPESQGPVRW
jgi:hypothetical protein